MNGMNGTHNATHQFYAHSFYIKRHSQKTLVSLHTYNVLYTAVENRKSIGIIKEKCEVIRCKILMLKLLSQLFRSINHHTTQHIDILHTTNLSAHLILYLTHLISHTIFDTSTSTHITPLSLFHSFPAAPQHIKWQNPESTHVYAFGQDIYKYLISNHLNNSIIISANLYDHR